MPRAASITSTKRLNALNARLHRCIRALGVHVLPHHAHSRDVVAARSQPALLQRLQRLVGAQHRPPMQRRPCGLLASRRRSAVLDAQGLRCGCAHAYVRALCVSACVHGVCVHAHARVRVVSARAPGTKRGHSEAQPGRRTCSCSACPDTCSRYTSTFSSPCSWPEGSDTTTRHAGSCWGARRRSSRHATAACAREGCVQAGTAGAGAFFWRHEGTGEEAQARDVGAQGCRPLGAIICGVSMQQQYIPLGAWHGGMHQNLCPQFTALRSI